MILLNKQLLLLFFFFKILIKLNYNKFCFVFLGFYHLNLKNIILYYNFLNLCRLLNNKMLFILLNNKMLFINNINNILLFIEFDCLNILFTKFKSNYFCNWRFSKLSFINYDYFNVRVSFFLFFRFTKYIEFFRAFKYYEFLSRWSIVCKNKLFKLTKYLNTNNFIIFISNNFSNYNYNLYINCTKISYIFKKLIIKINFLFLIQKFTIYFNKYKNLYSIYLLKYLYDFLNHFFVRDCLFKYRHFDTLIKLGSFCWCFNLPYLNYFRAKNFLFILKIFNVNKLFYLIFYYISFFKINTKLFSLSILEYIAVYYLKNLKYLNMNNYLKINFIMLWGYYREFGIFDFLDFFKLSTDFVYYKYSIFSSFFISNNIIQNYAINCSNFELYSKLNFKNQKLYFWFYSFLSNYLYFLKCQNLYFINFFKFIFELSVKLFNIKQFINFFINPYLIYIYINNYILNYFKFYRLSLQKYTKFVSYYHINRVEYFEVHELKK